MNAIWIRNKVDSDVYTREVIKLWLIDYRYCIPPHGHTYEQLLAQVILFAQPGLRPAYYVRLPQDDPLYGIEHCVLGPLKSLRKAKDAAEMLAHTGLGGELHSRD